MIKNQEILNFRRNIKILEISFAFILKIVNKINYNFKLEEQFDSMGNCAGCTGPQRTYRV